MILLFLPLPLQAGRVHSYIDEEGVKVFTNLKSDQLLDWTEEAPAEAGLEAQQRFLPIISEIASRHGLNEQLVEAIIQVESNFDSNAVSLKNCMGLMQLHPDTARRFGVSDIFDPRQNIEGGVRYLSFLIDYFDHNLDHVLAAYNAGEKAVERYQGIPPYRETVDYVRKVRQLFSGSLSQPEPVGQLQPILRLVEPDGRITYTNTP